MKNALALALLCGATLAACSTTPPPPAPPQPSIAKAAPPAETPAKAQPPQPPKPAKPPEAKKPAPEAAPKPQARPAPPPAVASTSKPAAPKPSAKPAAPPKTEPAAPPKAETVAKAPAPAPAAKPAPLDLKSLEQRLKESDAIGVMTKLSLKNQVDDLVDRFRAYHGGERPPTLPQLRPAFELLLMKVLSLLQDKDPALAHDIDASREAIWGVLSDRARFAQFT